MAGNDLLIYLGVHTAPTQKGTRAIAVALSGGAELYHFVDAGLDTGVQAVRDWLWDAGINPDNAAMALPGSVLIRDILVPEIGRRTLVVHHGDVDVPFVAELMSAVQDNGGHVSVSGIDLVGPVNSDVNAAAARRAFALQARYEAAIEIARKSALIHKVSGEVTREGVLTKISISGAFSKQSWTLESEEDAFFVLTSMSHMGPLAAFVIEPGPAQAELKRMANEFGLNEKLAA